MFDPVAFEIGPFLGIGPFAIRWYALAYIVSLLIGWRYCLWHAKRTPRLVSRDQLDDFFVWAILGVVLGGRIGFILFYDLGQYLQNPLSMLKVWEGGMSFHGGLIGVILAMILFTRVRKLTFFSLADIVATATPIGLFFGRLANFQNGELYGRITDVPWAMRFPGDPANFRHPSQLYEAGLEGLILFAVLFLLSCFDAVRRKVGTLSGVFLVGYSLSRIIVELVREPDPQLAALPQETFLSMGQWLSIPMLLYGLYVIATAKRVP
ncbi:MAG TPA: prolipoprotein diacylglyceryl transferase [Verrucomicrobiae bacterium]|nr:prolipoprotein diacylglyceryl transferase [Verrucomicrobiae bacterium]